MAVTVYWVEYITGESPGTTQHDNFLLASSHSVTAATNINFGNGSVRDLTTSTYPISAGVNSYTKYFRLQFSGSFTQISNAKVWKSAGAYVTGEYIWFSGSVDFAQPSVTSILSSLTDTEWTNFNTGRRIPTSQPSENNVVLYDNATESAGSSEAVLPHGSEHPDGAETESSPGQYSGSRSATLVFQLTTTGSTPAGPVNQKTMSLTYDRV